MAHSPASSGQFTIVRTNSRIATDEAVEDFHTLDQVGTLQVVKEVKKLTVMCVTSPEGGHLVPVANVAAALAMRQHKVQLVTCEWARKKIEKVCNKAGCEFVGVAPEVKAAESGEGEAAEFKAKDMMGAMFQHYNTHMHGPVRELAQKVKPDIIVGDFATPCSWEVAEELDIPHVVNIPGPAAMLNMFSPLGAWMFAFVAWLKCPKEEARAYREMGTAVLKCINSKPILLHTFFGLEAAQAVPANVFVTGSTAPRLKGGVSTTSDTALNEWVQWVKAEGLKIVYVTMGSMQVLEAFQVQGLYNGLAAVSGCAVLWSLKDDQQVHLPGGGTGGLPKRFCIKAWLPQAEALQLPEVAVVITHCGWGGLNETINAGKPIVATPFRADQPLNAKVAKGRGLAEILDTKTLKASEVTKAVETVLKTPSYAQCAKELQDLLLRTGGAVQCAEVVEQLSCGYKQLLPVAPQTLGGQIQEKLLPLKYFLFGAGAVVLVQRALAALKARR